LAEILVLAASPCRTTTKELPTGVALGLQVSTSTSAILSSAKNRTWPTCR